MVKAVAFFKRRAGMAVEEFQTYWLARHPDVVTNLSGVGRYVQSHTRLAAYRNAEPVYDGTAELWFEDTAVMRASVTLPRWRQSRRSPGGSGALHSKPREEALVKSRCRGDASLCLARSNTVATCRGEYFPRRRPDRTLGGGTTKCWLPLYACRHVPPAHRMRR
jgi:uncharacterized protein (TIGR02118 family)